MNKYLQGWRSLSRDEKQWFWRCWWSFAKWHLMIRFMPYKRWNKVIKKPFKNKGKQALTFSLSRAIAVSEMAGRHHIFPVNCLRRCIVQQQLLQHYGYELHLHFGVAKEGATLKAHCWLTYQGQLINDSIEVISTYSELSLAERQRQQLIGSLIPVAKP